MSRSDLDLTAVRARADAATPGPWHVEYLGKARYPQRVSNDTAVMVAETFVGGPADDAEFIAAARTDVPLLLAEVERLGKLIAAAQGMTASRIGADETIGRLVDEHVTTDLAFYAGVSFALAKVRAALGAQTEVEHA